jgi:predicted RNase H-like nuclease (RuvC/YqgF family)
MPNNGRYTLCPFYRDEKNLSISCEDTFRRFRWKAQKKRWLDGYCDKDWKSCPYAQELEKLYEGEDMSETKKLAHELKAKDRELRKTAAMLGKSEKREQSKDEQIRQLRRERNALEKLYIKARQKQIETEKKLDRLRQEFSGLSEIYEVRFAYLMAEFAGGVLKESEVAKWIAENEFALTADEFAGDGERKTVETWKVTVRKIEHEDRGPAGETEAAGRAKN